MNFQPDHPEETALLEREPELARLDALLAGARAGRGALMAIEGPPGIGKTSLLDAARARAEDMAVAAAAGSELEHDYGFGVARRLFEPILVRAGTDRHAALLDGPARLAAPALGLGATAAPGGGADALYAVLHGLFWLTTNLAAQSPVLIVVDDLQWADAPSQRFLAYLARRLEGMPVALLVALRPPVPGEERETVEAIVGERRTETLRPAPLSEAAVAALARTRLGTESDPELAGACHRATGGNALLVRELLTELRDRPATTQDIEHIGPERVARSVLRRTDALGPAAAALAGAVAILGDGCTREAAAALAGIGDDDAVRAAAALAAADVLADGVPLRFRHPVVRAAVTDRLPAVERAATHGRAARLLDERDAPIAAVATQLVLAEPAADPWTVEPLRAAAREARDQGAPDLAAAYLRRALAEPPPAATRADVARELGSAALAAGLPEADGHLEEALGLLEEPCDRADVALELGTGLADRGRWGEASAVARRGLRDLGDADRERGLKLEAVIAFWARMDASTRSEKEEEHLRRRAAALPGDTPGERLLIAAAANLLVENTAADHARAATLLERGMAAGETPPGPGSTAIVSSLIRAERLDDAERFVERRLEQARAGGLVHQYAFMIHMRGWIALERGELASAEADLRAGVELAVELDMRGSRGVPALQLALAHAEQGRLDDAERLVTELDLAGELPVTQVMNVALFFRSRVRHAQGRGDEARADALEVGRRYAAWGIHRAVPAWRSLAAVLEPNPAEARRLAEEELELAERWGTPTVIGRAQRGLGLVTRDLGRLRKAVELCAASPARLEEARAYVELGAALRRTGQRVESRPPLQAGMDAAHACGAVPLAERARDELRATGARPRRLALSGAQALTASERRVAELAARGLTNRLIAQELFVTVATVETHLRHAFQKLDVGSRRELAGALSSPRPAAAPGTAAPPRSS